MCSPSSSSSASGRSPRWKAASSAEVRHWRRGMGKPWRDQTATAQPPCVPETAARELPIILIASLSQQAVIMSKERDPSNQSDTPQPGRRPPGTSLTLLQRLRDNEPEAWRTMVQLYTPLLCHWCARDDV